MITATYFGEITELGSRAVWYSDEEEEDDSHDEDVEMQTTPKQSRISIEMSSHDSIRSNVTVDFKRLHPIDCGTNIVNCVVSLFSNVQFKNFKFQNPSSQLKLLGYFGNFGRVFLCPHSSNIGIESEQSDFSLYLTFNSSDTNITGHRVAYFIEALRDQLYSELNLDHSIPILILSQQFARGETLEYLSNYATCGSIPKCPFNFGQPIAPPALIKSQFESALFEQLTLTLKPAFVVCLPDPKDYWFDKSSSWPSVADEIISHRLSDDSLEKTLIFT